ncbi:Homeobox domain [Carpediemonas membranifera]|uniref:Homeobox domain n=1 Tax=Carpediemonas membranifera TaxID=201153 RepID=A0A8J6C0N1_9EUKA|nr:Homeobox domain [Carpediemonas membranifera]|eukprot:KAG9396756.1 Homeobox domain [Carpediemonas membranifera]
MADSSENERKIAESEQHSETSGSTPIRTNPWPKSDDLIHSLFDRSFPNYMTRMHSFSAFDSAMLCCVYRENPYPDRGQLHNVAKYLEMDECRVSKWFQIVRNRAPRVEAPDPNAIQTPLEQAHSRIAKEILFGMRPEARDDRRMYQMFWRNKCDLGEDITSRPTSLPTSYPPSETDA